MESEVLTKLHQQYEAQKQIELEARKNAEKVRYEKYGFRNWEEVLSYLKRAIAYIALMIPIHMTRRRI